MWAPWLSSNIKLVLTCKLQFLKIQRNWSNARPNSLALLGILPAGSLKIFKNLEPDVLRF